MKRFLCYSYALLLTGFVYNPSMAQLTGTISVPGGTYASLDAVITALNQQGVGAGGVTLNITADQNAPAGGYVLGSNALYNSLSAANPLLINGRGFTITAQTGTGAADGIFTLTGTDYVTFDSLHLRDNPANTTDDTKMEWGYGLFKQNGAAPFNGCHHVIIRKCRISMRYSATRFTYGIYGDHRITGATAAMVLSSALPGDAHSHGQIRDNIISGCLEGIRFYGMNDASNHNIEPVITGNNITFGGTGSNTGFGINVEFAVNARITANTIQLAAGNTITVNAISAGTGSGDLTITGNRLTMVGNNTASGITGITLRQSYAGRGTLRCTDNICEGWNMLSATSGLARGIYINNSGNAFDTMLITGNRIRRFVTGSGAHTGQIYGIQNLSGNATPYVRISGNVIDSIIQRGTASGVYAINTSINTGPSILHITDNEVTRIQTTTTNAISSYGIQAAISTPQNITAHIGSNRIGQCTFKGNAVFFGLHVVAAGGTGSTVSGNTIADITSEGGDITGMHCSFATPAVFNNTIRNLKTGTGILYGYHNAGGIPTVYNNRYDSLGTVTGTVYGYYNAGSLFAATTPAAIYNNNFSNLYVQGASGSLYGLYFPGVDGTIRIYNNFISDFHVGPSYSGKDHIAGIYMDTSAAAGFLNHMSVFRIYHNTIRFGNLTTSGDLGITGIRFAGNPSGRLKADIRNNIINVNVVPSGGGFTAAIRRADGVQGVFSGDLLPSSNGNIYYVPTTDSCFIYVEGTPAAPPVNAYSLRNDPLFNTTCGLSEYKSFTGAEQGSFTENNLTSGTAPGTWIPSGASYAKSLGVATSDPQVTADYAGVTRSATPDAGALEFAGVLADVTPPSVSYTPLPSRIYCLTQAPVLQATITDPSGVAVGSGTRPRIYYRKAVERDTFGYYPADNNVSFNGWKYAEASGNGPVFTFQMNYALLQTPVAAGDSIVYFIAAQDSVATPNVGIQSGGLATGYCAVSVNLEPAAGPLTALPVSNGYRIQSPQFTVSARYTEVCAGGSVPLRVSPVPQGMEIRWQQDGGTGNWTDVPGTDSSRYTTGPLTGNSAFRAALFTCGSSNDSVVTSGVNITVYPTPQIASVTPGVHCGAGAVTLQATAAQGNDVRWYHSVSSDTILYTGASFATPFLTETRDYYVSASGAPGNEIVPSPTTSARTLNIAWNILQHDSMYFQVYRPVTIHSVKMYPAHDAPSGTASISVVIRDTTNGVNHTGPTHQFTPSATPSEETVPVNISLQPGVYRITATMTGINSLNTSTGASFPYAAPSGALEIIPSGISSSVYKYFYEWAVSSACEGPRTKVSATIDSVTATITASGPTSFCEGAQVMLYGTADTGLAYRWQKDGSAIAGATDSSYTTGRSGAYTVIVSNANCADTTASITVTVHSLPTPVIIPDGQDLTTGDYETYQWNLNGSAVPAANDRRFTPVEDGAYTVTVTDTNGCIATSDIHRTGTGVYSSYDTRYFFTLYPNPNNGVFTLKGSWPQTHYIRQFRMEIMDITGRVLVSQVIPADGDALTYPVSMDAIHAPGAYFIRLHAGQERYVLHFIKE